MIDIKDIQSFNEAVEATIKELQHEIKNTEERLDQLNGKRAMLSKVNESIDSVFKQSNTNRTPERDQKTELMHTIGNDLPYMQKAPGSNAKPLQ